MINDKLKNSKPIVLSSYETSKELDLDKMFNYLGPEASWILANKLIDIVKDDYIKAMSDNYDNL